MNSTFESMDNMYRRQRYFYDLTRKFYLLGRDQLLSQMQISTGESILEVGCGTGRNLCILAKRYPQTRFFGLDASSEMLATAAANIRSARVSNIKLETALADAFSHKETFDQNEGFDAIFFSYSLSMIPTWSDAIVVGLNNLRPGGTLYLVDFYDQADLPVLFQKLLKSWLGQFHVRYPAELPAFLKDLELNGAGRLEMRALFRRYSFIASLTTS
ncbi:MAG: class I SAM-dependent methyltransferase [Pyrinomonadaceae bacterium]